MWKLTIPPQRQLLFAVATALLVVAAVLLPFPTPLRFGLVLLYLLFIPGWVFLWFLFPEQDRLAGIERPILAVGTSVAVVAMAGFLLNYTPWRITLYPVVSAITLFILVSALLAWLRLRRLPAAGVSSLERPFPPAAEQGAAVRLVGVGVWLSLAAAIGALGYAILVPVSAERFTEFYLLNEHGKASLYPRLLSVGEETVLGVGIVNRQGSPASYRVEIWQGSFKLKETGPVTLAPGERWEGIVSFAPVSPGEDEKIEFRLIQGEGGASQLLHLRLKVMEPGQHLSDLYLVFLPSRLLERMYRWNTYEAVIGIHNHEASPNIYRVEMWISGVAGTGKAREVGPISLAPGETWEGNLEFIPETRGLNQVAVFLLYREGEKQPVRSLSVPIHVF